MNRLWVRLSMAFSALIVFWVLLIGILPPLIIRWQMAPETRSTRAYGRLEDQLSRFYTSRGNWDGVQTLLEGAQAALSPRQAGIVLADSAGRILYDAQPAPGTAILDPAQRGKAIMIRAQGRTIGYLGTRPEDEASAPSPERFLLEQLLRILLLAAVVGGPTAIVAGVLMSRNLTSPLNRLAEAARNIGSHNFDFRVEPVGTAEMIEVATAFNEMVEGLKRGESLRRNMMADVAHELRTPLSVIQGSLQAIIDDVYPLTKEEITHLYDQTRHLSHVVNDLHQLAQAEAGQLPLNLQPTDLSALARDVAAGFGPVAEAEGVTLTLDVPADLPCIEADPARLTQVLYNLVSNALRHTPSGGKIVIGGGQDPPGLRPGGKGGSAWVSVQDSGEGISADHLPHVFERFYRADPARGRDTGGAGLGLAVARAIVEEHGGQITAASEGVPGRGSTFTVRLPIKSCRVRAADDT
jgi:signal transduction histidine kinase